MDACRPVRVEGTFAISCVCSCDPAVLSTDTSRWIESAGAEDFELELGPWSVLGQRALVAPNFQPDFDAVALPPCRLLRIPRSAYSAAMTAVRPASQLNLPAVRLQTGWRQALLPSLYCHPLAPVFVLAFPRCRSRSSTQTGSGAPCDESERTSCGLSR